MYVRKKAVAFFIATILLACAGAVIGSGNEGKAEPRSGHASHGPIWILGNDGFTATNGVKSGDGSRNNPYMIEGWDIDASSDNGIKIEGTGKYFVIRNIYVHGSGKYSPFRGIHLSGVQNGSVENCEITNTGGGISIGKDSSNNNVKGNNIYDNENGISLTSDLNENIISNNISNNSYGIYIWDSFNNKVYGNTVFDNGYGIFIRTFGNSPSSNNIIYQNNLMNSTNLQASDDSNHKWSYKNKGNYWSDYIGTDANGDGIGDTPYSIPGEGNKDNYPLMKKVAKADIISWSPAEKKEEAKKGFIPGAEAGYLLCAIGIGTISITVRRKRSAPGLKAIIRQLPPNRSC